MNSKHTHSSTCSCCGISRRCFLASTAAAGLTIPLITSAQMEFPTESELKQPINLGDFRPKPAVRIVGVVVREKPPYWLGWPGTSYDVEGMRKQFEQAFINSANKVGVQFEMLPDPIEDDTALEKFINQMSTEKPEAILVHVQHLNEWGRVDKIRSAKVPMIVWAPLGTVFTTQVHEFARREGVCLLSTLDTSCLEQAMRMVRAKKQFEMSRILVVHGKERKDEVIERYGTKIRHVPRDMMEKMFERVPITEEVKEVAESMKKKAQKVVEPTDEDMINAARSYVAAKHLLRMEDANAITTDCLGMVTMKTVPTPPCLGACIFQDEGVTYGCEADVYGAMSLMLTSYLFDKPGFMNDPVPETIKNELITAHCVCGTKLNGFDKPSEPFIIRSHSESALGVSLQVLWKIGQAATLVRLQNPNELILDNGTVTANIDTPPAGGCRTHFSLKMDYIEEAKDTLGFHQVVFYGNHRRDVKNFCQMYGIKVIHSPSQANPMIPMEA
ncbi:MAG TPA: hypothetical protein PLA12_04570 [Candidatus Hydrogenedens sp.]|nr:hypothetical protein [Candidatus Hydrogenedens sp.]